MTTGHASSGDFDRVLVVDFGAQYAQLIARRVREAHVFSEIVSRGITAAEVRSRQPGGIILSGGPASVYAEDAYEIDPEILTLGIPVLGICYGHQVLAHALGGDVAHNEVAEYGRTELAVVESGVLFHELPAEQTVWMSHRDAVARAPEGFAVTASTSDSPVAAMEDRQRGLYGVQFHPEVAHTERGQEVLKHFLYNACGLRPTWTHVGIIEQAVDGIRTSVGDGTVICGLSGGVDSSVAAALVHKAVGDQLVCVFVDHGLLRKGEAEQVEETFLRHFHVNLIHVKAQDRFLDALAGVTDPERKRKIIGETFIRVFEEVAAEVSDAKYLVQGTLYPDVIESGTKDAAKIKSHHNVGGLPDEMDFELVEPLRDLFKDEVRAVGEELGLPEEIVWRQPFPGPGLAVRIIGDITQERLEILREADAIVTEEIRRAGLYREIWQSFGVLPAIRSVGVQGDGRTYAYPLIIRAVTSEDAMTADWARIPYDVLERISSRVINEVPGINRVAYDVTSKPPGTIEWE
ncbi:MAG TPA: glutamine-hydrolyzing GMP synthase [Acidimicrobiia bacterium]|jgi:GMP synthase (glutamine-hydrolysing)|nr:glutamine-hydrolyzing GMP synthase [Acidimicrobiia bacterium]